MRQELRDLLLSFDEKDNWEFPADFEWEKLSQLLKEFIKYCESILDLKVKLDDEIQDASFFARIEFPVDKNYNREKDSKSTLNHIYFKFSNFGKLFTLGHNPDAENQYYKEILKCKEYLKEKGFIYIENIELDAPYDGVNEPYEEGLTWRIRYFDYL